MSVEQTKEELFMALFAKELRNTVLAREIYSALCNNRWESDVVVFDFSWRAAGEFIANLRNDMNLPLDDPEVCQRCGKKFSKHVARKEELSFALLGASDREPIYVQRFYCSDEGGDLFLEGRTRAEDYLDYYCSGDEGSVAPWIRERFAGSGYQRADYS